MGMGAQAALHYKAQRSAAPTCILKKCGYS